MLGEFGENGPILAILDGRFLPTDSLSLNVERDVDKVNGMGMGQPSTVVKSESISVTFQTARDPQARKRARSFLVLQNRKHRVTLDDPQVIQSPLDINFGNTWEVEVMASDLSVSEL